MLRSRGVSVPTRARVVKVDTALEAEATLSPPDPQGAMLFSISRREPSGRYHVGEVVIREPWGIVEAGAGWLSGSQLKENRNRTMEGFGTAPVAVPVAWARHRIAEARKLNAASGQVLPLGLERFGDLLDPVPEAKPAHPLAYLEEELTAERAATAAAGSGAPPQRAGVPRLAPRPGRPRTSSSTRSPSGSPPARRPPTTPSRRCSTRR